MDAITRRLQRVRGCEESLRVRHGAAGGGTDILCWFPKNLRSVPFFFHLQSNVSNKTSENCWIINSSKWASAI